MRVSTVIHTFRYKGQAILNLEGLQWRFGEGDQVQIDDENYKIISIRNSFSVVQYWANEESPEVKVYVEYSLEKVKEKSMVYY